MVYPCIEIIDSGAKKEIIFHQTEKYNSKQVFIKKAKYWYGYGSHRGDTSMFYIHDFVIGNKKIMISYTDTVTFNVHDIEFANNDSICAYFPNERFSSKKKFPLDDTLSIKSNYQRCWTQKAVNNNGVIKLLEYDIYPDGRIENRGQQQCFKNTQRSSIWWAYFSTTAQDIKCDSNFQ